MATASGGLTMIVDVPAYEDLHETGVGWLNLAWETAIGCLRSFQDNVEYYEEHLDEQMSPQQQDAFWHAQRFRLNNAVALLQQAMELLLKAKIAEVSPFLLIASEPRSWPKSKPEMAGDVSFTDFRTIDASQLCHAVGVVASEPPSADFAAFYEEMRKRRNRIAHLHAGNIRVEARRVIADVVMSFQHLFPGLAWSAFRRNYLVVTGEPTLAPYEDDPTHTYFLAELRVAIEALDSKAAKAFLGFDAKRERLPCPKCRELQVKWDDTRPDLAQRRSGQVECIACGSSFTAAEYDNARGEWFDDEDSG